MIRDLSVLLLEGVNKIADGKQSRAQDRACKIKVVTHAILQTPMHPRKKLNGFTDMGEYNQGKRARANDL